MNEAKQVLLAVGISLAVFAHGGVLTKQIGRSHSVRATDIWCGGQRTVFDFEGYEAWVVEPKDGTALAGRPWTWTMQWATAFVSRTGVPQLLDKGWHHATIVTFKDKMDETGIKVSERFQRFLVDELGLAPKANLIGLSWGGFFSIRYAARFPQNVAKIYLDCPLLNLGGRCGTRRQVSPGSATAVPIPRAATCATS